MNSIKVLSTKKLDADFLDASMFGLTELDFISVQPINSKAIANIIKELAGQETEVVFTSSNAVKAISPYLNDAKAWKIFCLAGKTLDTVKQRFTANIVATANFAGELAEKIIELGSTNVMFFCGDIRRDDLPGILRKAGISVEELIVYTTMETPHILQEEFDAVMFYSPSAVRSFFQSNKLTASAVCFSIGNTTTAELNRFTNNIIITAEIPTQEQIAEQVKNYFEQTVGC